MVIFQLLEFKLNFFWLSSNNKNKSYAAERLGIFRAKRGKIISMFLGAILYVNTRDSEPMKIGIGFAPLHNCWRGAETI